MQRSQLIAVLVGLTTIAALSSPAHARLYQMMHGSNVYPGVATPMPPMPAGPMMAAPMAGGFGRLHAGVNIYPAIPSPIPHPDGSNLYQYVRSNPVRLVDPYGLQASQPAVPNWSLAEVAKGIVATSKKAGHPRPVECIFSYSKRTVCCTDGKHSYCCEAISGAGAHMNNPDSQGVQNEGPIHTGEWWAGKSHIHHRQSIYWHDLQKKVGGTYQPYDAKVDPGGRSLFGFHSGNRSAGCITVLNRSPANAPAMDPPYGNQCFKNLSFLIGQSKYCDKKWNGGARVFVER